MKEKINNRNLIVASKKSNKKTEVNIASDETISLSENMIKKLLLEEKIPQDIGTHLLTIFEDQKKINELQNQLDNVSSSTNKDPNQLATLQHLLTIKNCLDQYLISSKIPQEFYKNIDTEKCFGIVQVLTDRLRYIPELLEKLELVALKNEGTARYMIRASIKLKDIGEIGLSYAFTLPANQNIKEAFLKYHNDMKDALKVYLAYWDCANRMGNFQYLAPITEIMATAQKETRKDSWSSSEKKRFWELSKLLENTKITFKCKVDREWIDVKTPLLDLSVTASTNKDQELKKGYPDKVMPLVLNPSLKNTTYRVTEFSKGTLLLRPEDIPLAFYSQARAAQRLGSNSTKIDEEYAMKLAGLSKTYKSNPRMARKKLREKLEKLKVANAISDWEKEADSDLILLYRASQKK